MTGAIHILYLRCQNTFHDSKLVSLIISFIFFPGLCGPAFCFYREYYFVNTSLIWCDALTYCQNNYTNLVSIQSQNQSNQILSLAQNTFQDAAWVGLSRIDSQNWQWSDGSNVTYTNWERELFCAAVNADGTWTDFTCSTNFYFICYLDSGNTSRSFFLVRQSVTWYAAQQYCRSHYTNLVSIRNQAENEEVINSAQSFTVWTGLFNNPWKWSDGSRVTFFNWNTQEPNDVGGTEYCVQQFTSGFWNDITCNMNNPFVCCEGRTNLSGSCSFQSRSTTWLEAQSFCRKNNMDLASIQSMTEIQQLTNLVPSASFFPVWTGLYREGQNWQWSNGDAAIYYNWKAVYYCGALNVQGTWNDINCSVNKTFFCYKGNGYFKIMF
ncbi:MRC1 protein, partial [Polypterus senegalus]|nr:MRC1 protein [Polypterus senegalus]